MNKFLTPNLSWIQEHFGEGVISSGTLLANHSPDLNPLHFHLCECLKDQILFACESSVSEHFAEHTQKCLFLKMGTFGTYILTNAGPHFLLKPECAMLGIQIEGS